MRSLIGLALSTILAVCAPSAANSQEATFGYNPLCSNAVVASCQFKTAGGMLLGAHAVNWGAATVVIFLVDTNGVPVSGQPVCSASAIANNTCQVVRAYPLAVGSATAPTMLDLPISLAGLLFQQGILLLCSSTGLSGGVMTYTASTNCTFDAETR